MSFYCLGEQQEEKKTLPTGEEKKLHEKDFMRWEDQKVEYLNKSSSVDAALLAQRMCCFNEKKTLPFFNT